MVICSKRASSDSEQGRVHHVLPMQGHHTDHSLRRQRGGDLLHLGEHVSSTDQLLELDRSVVRIEPFQVFEQGRDPLNNLGQLLRSVVRSTEEVLCPFAKVTVLQQDLNPGQDELQLSIVAPRQAHDSPDHPYANRQLWHPQDPQAAFARVPRLPSV